MAVHCTNCGEELLGAVNRCWRCGTPFVAQAGAIDLPPVRRAPVHFDQPVVVLGSVDELSSAGGSPSGPAALAGHEQSETPWPLSAQRKAEPISEADIDSQEARASPNEAAISPGEQWRVGSPFAASTDRRSLGSAPSSFLPPAERPKYPLHAAATGGAYASFVVGVISLIASFFSVSALLIAVVALGMGVWGLYSSRRRLALCGIFLSCIALAFGGFNGVVLLYTEINGVSPWEANLPEEEEIIENEFLESF